MASLEGVLFFLESVANSSSKTVYIVTCDECFSFWFWSAMREFQRYRGNPEGEDEQPADLMAVTIIGAYLRAITCSGRHDTGVSPSEAEHAAMAYTWEEVRDNGMGDHPLFGYYADAEHEYAQHRYIPSVFHDEDEDLHESGGP